MYEVSTAVRHTHNKDGGIVLDIDRGQMFRLNPVGALILESLAQGVKESEIALEISRQYNISEEIALNDVSEFLQTLRQHKLIQGQEQKGAV